jgi:hypothetical protein
VFENRMLRKRFKTGCRGEAGEQDAEDKFENRMLRKRLRAEC